MTSTTDTSSQTSDPATILQAAASAPFGTVFGEVMSVARVDDDGWSTPSLEALSSFYCIRALTPCTTAARASKV